MAALPRFLQVNPVTVVGLLRCAAVPKGGYLLQTAAGSVLGRQVIQVGGRSRICLGWWGLKGSWHRGSAELGAAGYGCGCGR